MFKHALSFLLSLLLTYANSAIAENSFPLAKMQQMVENGEISSDSVRLVTTHEAAEALRKQGDTQTAWLDGDTAIVICTVFLCYWVFPNKGDKDPPSAPPGAPGAPKINVIL